jgi:hypothetical protein
MTDFSKVFNIYSTESGQEENSNAEQTKRANASKMKNRSCSYFFLNSFSGINQDFSKKYVRITIRIPQMKTGRNWRKFTREAKNGLTTKATYHGTYVTIYFIIIIIIIIIINYILYLVECILNLYSIKVNQ